MTIAEFDQLDKQQKETLLFNCCGCRAWVKGMLEIFPVQDLIDLLEYAEEKWYDCNPAEWLEAFEHHPKIGDIESIQKKFANTANYAQSEQAGVAADDKKVLEELMQANEEYEDTFGYIFIVCATGKTAPEMLEILNERLLNNPHDELLIAAGEQDKITKLRLQKLFA